MRRGTDHHADELGGYPEHAPGRYPGLCHDCGMAEPAAPDTERACTAEKPHGECRYGNGPRGTGWHCYRAAQAGPPPLDVRRLAKTMRNLYKAPLPGEYPVLSSGDAVMDLLEPFGKKVSPWHISAARIVAEYARLSRTGEPSDA